MYSSGLDATYEFRSDGKIYAVGVTYSGQITYTTTDNITTLFMHFSDGLVLPYVPVGYTISGTVLTITCDDGALLPGTYYKPRR